MLWLAVFLGGGLGALARYSISTLGGQTHWPWQTLFANVIGALCVGAAYVLIIEKSMLPPWTRQFVMVGFLGALTTFSTFSLETLHMFQRGEHIMALVYSLGSVVLSVLGVFLGLYFAQKYF